MIPVAKEWNPKQNLLKELLQNPGKFSEAIALCLEMHAMLHSSEMSGGKETTYEDNLWNGLTDEAFRSPLQGKNTTIAWDLWHITRIEDLTAAILIGSEAPALDASWLKRLNTAVRDTGNAMTPEEIVRFSSAVDMNELKHYRTEVGKKTRDILHRLATADLKRKFRPEQMDRIVSEGGVLDHPDSKWLLDFWGRKNVAGILQMPITRHQIVHLNDALEIRERLMK